MTVLVNGVVGVKKVFIEPKESDQEFFLKKDWMECMSRGTFEGLFKPFKQAKIVADNNELFDTINFAPVAAYIREVRE